MGNFSLPNSRIGLRWSLLSLATLAVLAAGSYEEVTDSPVARARAVDGRMRRGADESLLRGSISGVIAENRSSFMGDMPRFDRPLGGFATMDRQWRNFLIKRQSRLDAKSVAFWGFVSGKTVEETGTERSSVFGERVDEAFFMDMDAIVARERKDTPVAWSGGV
jgi:hypothetical protein